MELPQTFLVLNLGLDVVDGVATLHLEGDRLPGQRLHEDLHCSRSPAASAPSLSPFPFFPPLEDPPCRRCGVFLPFHKDPWPSDLC